MKRLFFALTAAVLLLVNFSTAVFAQATKPTSNCSAVVVDDAGVLGNSLANVRSTAETLQNRSQGTVRILLAKDAGKNAKAYRENQLAKQCPNDWGRTDLLSIIIGMGDQTDDVFAGGKYSQKLSAQSVDDIRTKTLEAALGNFARGGKRDVGIVAQGLIDSMGIMQQAVAAPAAPATKPAAPVAAQPAAPAGPPPNLTGLWIALAVIIAIVVFFFALTYFRNMRKENEAEGERKRQEAQNVEDARLTAVRNVNGLDTRVTTLKTRAAALQSTVSAEAYQRLSRKVTAAANKADQVAIDFGNTNGSSASVASWNALNRDAVAANESIRDAENACETLENDPSATLMNPTPPPPPAPAPAPQPVYQTVAPPPPAPAQTYEPQRPVQVSHVSSYDLERGEANDAYDTAYGQVVRTERYILENSRFISQSAWGDLDEAREELGRADRASTSRSKREHARKANRAAEAAMRGAERDMNHRRDYSRDPWYYDRYQRGYVPYADNNTFIIYEPVYVPQQTGYVHDSGARAETSSRTGNDSNGTWGKETANQGNDSNGTWGTTPAPAPAPEPEPVYQAPEPVYEAPAPAYEAPAPSDPPASSDGSW